MTRWSYRNHFGIATVEMAIVGLLTFTLLFGSLEFGRVMYTWNTLTEGTRRGARVAAVCPKNDVSIANYTIFKTRDGTSTGMDFPNLTTANVRVEYLKNDGTAAPGGTSDADYAAVDFVRVSIINYQFISTLPVHFDAPFCPPDDHDACIFNHASSGKHGDSPRQWSLVYGFLIAS